MAHTLKFLAGPHQGGLFPVEAGREVVIGRQTGLELVLADDLVSRRHARLWTAGENLLVEDLGSTNGTFVNGERIQRRALKDGDRILIGGSILKLVGEAALGSMTPAEARAGLERAAKEPRRASAMQGRLDEVPLADLLQLFGTSKKSGVLTVTQGAHRAEVRLAAGRILGCAMDGRPGMPPLKAFYRLLSWQDGTFDLGPPTGREEAGTPLVESMEGLLMEGMRQQDELARLAPSLPPPGARLEAVVPPPAGTPPPGPRELGILEILRSPQTLQAVLDRSPLTDLEAARAAVSLLEQGHLRLA